MTDPVSRRKFLQLAGLGGTSLLSGYAFGVEPYRPLLTRETVQSSGASPSLSVRLVHLTDLHFGTVGRLERETARIVKELRPDFIVITGDVCNRPEAMEGFDRFLALTGDSAPVYGVPGNWEYRARIDLDELDRVYRRHGGRLLRNESVTINHNGAKVLVTGFDDAYRKGMDIGKALTGVQPTANHLLLSHFPSVRDMLEQRKPEFGPFTPRFLLVGHTHGGQVTFFGFPPYLPEGSNGYVHGWYGVDGLRMYVSRGIGTTSIPARFMAPPEIVCFQWFLRPDAGSGARS